MESKICENKEAIIAEYILGGTSYRKLGAKYNIDFRVIHSWVMKNQGKSYYKSKKGQSIKAEPLLELPKDVKQLQADLRKAQLHNKLLNAMIDIAETQLKIDIRKKPGTKQ